MVARRPESPAPSLLGIGPIEGRAQIFEGLCLECRFLSPHYRELDRTIQPGKVLLTQTPGLAIP